ncbi:VOC family protein [Sporolactobacillus sp. Y61]|jgi:glyoxylase I family protein|uniref:VOC family protein n=1 Tax=Sporolactobacillus sp. Y61 TaxID=3160863 RepID=A0AAU8IEF0_9BACL|nr:VOC family protein [Sporolactobacillus sp. THM19-2]RYL93173.1 VOC family protein [Sporolactobacillus sp. THM19-2]
MSLLRFHHCAIICSNYRKSKHFYTKVLGFRVLQETYRKERKSYKLDLQLENNESSRIELFSFPDPPARLTRPEACGLRHLAFAVNSVRKTVQELNMKGVVCEPVRIDELTGKPFTFFRDPDDLPLELYEC